MPASTFQSESFQKMLVIGVQAKDLHLLFIKNYYKVMEKNSERGYCIPLFRKTKRIMKITTFFRWELHAVFLPLLMRRTTKCRSTSRTAVLLKSLEKLKKAVSLHSFLTIIV